MEEIQRHRVPPSVIRFDLLGDPNDAAVEKRHSTEPYSLLILLCNLWIFRWST